MTHQTPVLPYRSRISLGLLLGASLLPAVAAALEIQLPSETATYQPSELPGYAAAQANCLTCHSAQYVISQPPGSPRAYWDATVHKMKKVFGAPLRDEDLPAIVDYLTKTYGAERGAATAGGLQEVSLPPTKTAAPAPATAAPADAASLMAANGCMACHAVDHKVVGPAFKDVAARYRDTADPLATVARNIRAGGAGKWGPTPMPPFPGLSDAELKTLAAAVLSN